MELRATASGTSVSKIFVAAVLVLVAMGLGATGGYLARGLGASGAPAAAAPQVQSHPAELPGYIQNEIDRATQQTPRISTTDPNFIQQYAQKPAAQDNQHEPNRIQKDDPYASDSAPRAIHGGGDLVQ